MNPNIVLGGATASLFSIEPEEEIGGLLLRMPELAQQPAEGICFDPLKEEKVVHISTSITDDGLNLGVRQGSSFATSLNLLFPRETWAMCPPNLKEILRNNLSHLSSIDFGIMWKLQKIKYDTPLPQFKSFFIELVMKCLVYSSDLDSGKAVNYLSRLCNLDFSFACQKLPQMGMPCVEEERSINTMTFGKESLLSYALSKELGLNPVPVTIMEPDLDVEYRGKHIRSFENKHKAALMKQFEAEFGVRVYAVYNGFSELGNYEYWNCDATNVPGNSQLTEYLFYMLPFSCQHKAKYLLFGNEQSCDQYYFSKEGFKCNPVYDQSAEWMGHMNAMMHSLWNGAVKVSSFVQPIHEIAVAKILYQRYPELARYQTSCHMDNVGAEFSRWCNRCSKCARIYTFMRALKFDPSSVGLSDMFKAECKDFFSLFHQDNEMCGYDSSGLGKDEQLFAFLLATKNGATGDLIDLFKKELYTEALSREEELRGEFFKVHKPLNIPAPLWRRIKPIFEEELKK